MRGKPKNLLKTHDAEVLHNLNSILNSKQNDVTSHCSVPLSSAVEQPVAHEPTQFNVRHNSQLEGMSLQVAGSASCGLKRKTQEDDMFDVFDRYMRSSVRGTYSHIILLVHPRREITLDFEQSVVCCDNVTRMPRSVGKEIILEFEQLAICVSYEYTDLGDCDQQCLHCGVAFWFDERLKGHSNSRRPEYHLYYKGRTVYIEQNLDPPKTARDRCREIDIPEFKIRLCNGNGARGYELPALNTLGVIVFDSRLIDSIKFDVIIEHRGGPPKRIDKLYRSCMSLQFPLLFIRGQSGFHIELKLRRANENTISIISPNGQTEYLHEFRGLLNSKASIGRLAYVHPITGELFYFQMLLCHQKGCRDFPEVQAIHDIFYPSCRATCEALGFLGDKNEWDTATQEECASATSLQLRFVHLGLGLPPSGPLDMLANRFLMEERNYNQEELQQQRDKPVPRLKVF
nr:helitron helicase-like domain-containing protein [Tanacetum cinerariifolium]